MMLRALLRPTWLLGLFAVVATGLLAFTYENTREQIAQSERNALLRRLNELIPEAQHENDLLTDTIEIPANDLLGTTATTTGYRARRAGRIEAIAFTAVAPDGYNGAIRLLVAIERDGRVAGVRVVSHRETPGLGDAIEIERSPWISGFDGRSLSAPNPTRWRVRKDGGDFEQLTGATITPRAIVKAIKNSLQFFAMHRDTLLNTGTTTVSQNHE